MIHEYQSVQEGTGDKEQMVSFKEQPCSFSLCPKGPCNVAAGLGLNRKPRTHGA